MLLKGKESAVGSGGRFVWCYCWFLFTFVGVGWAVGGRGEEGKANNGDWLG